MDGAECVGINVIEPVGRLNVGSAQGAKRTGLALQATSNYDILRAVIKGCNPQHLLWLSMLHFHLMLG